MQSDYNAWARGEVYLNKAHWRSSNSEFVNKCFVTKEEAIDILTKKEYHPFDIDELVSLDNDALEEIFLEEEFYTCDNYMSESDCSIENFWDCFTTPGGEMVVAFGYAGYDG